MKKAFNTAGLRRAGQSSNDFIHAICRERPDLADATFYAPGSGISGHTLITENEVFKAPLTKTPRDIFSSRLEYNVQQRFFEHGLPVPPLTYRGKEECFFGMQRIDGTSIDLGFVEALTPEQRTTFAQDIAKAMVGMAKAFSADEIKTLGIQDSHLTPTEEIFLEVLNNPQTQDELGPKFDFCRDALTEYLVRLADKKQHITHIDLNSGNLLVNWEAKKLAAIIDFGDVAYTVPEATLIPLRAHCTPSVLSQICTEYSTLTGENLAYKDIVFYNLYQVAHAIHSLVKRGQSKLGLFLNDIERAERELCALDTPKTPAAKTPQIPLK